jgi:hypothetical protein
MAEELIDSYVDRNGVKGDTDFIVSSLREVYGEFKKLESVKVDLRGASGLASLSPLMQQAKVGADSLAVATDTVSKRIAEMNGKSKEFTQVLVGQTRATKEASAATLNSAKAKTEEAKARYYNAKAANEEAKSVTETNKARVIEEKLIKQINKEKENLSKEIIKEVDRQAKLNNEYEQLKHRYLLAANAAKQLAAAKGLENAETQEAITVAAQYSAQLFKIEQAVGQSQRNVGNYTQATFALTQVIREAPAFANSFAIGISAISNNVPILIDQIKALIAQNVILRSQGLKTIPVFSMFAKSLLSINTILPVGFLLLQIFATKMAGAGSATKQFVKELDSADRKLKDIKKSIDDFNAAAEFLKKIGEITVDFNFGDDFERSLLKAQQASVGMDNLVYKLKNDVANAGKIASDVFDLAYSKISRSTTYAINDFVGQFENLPDELINDQKKSDQKYLKQLKESSKDRIDIEKDLTKAIQDQSIARANIRLLNQNEERKKQKEAAEQAKKDAEEAEKLRLELLERNRKAAFEITRLGLQQDIDFNNEVVENDKRGLVEREQALRLYKLRKIELINATADFEIASGKKTAKELEAIEDARRDGVLRAEREAIKKRVELYDQFKEQVLEQEEELQEKLVSVLNGGTNQFIDEFAKRQEAYKKHADKIIDEEKRIKEETRKLYKDLYAELSETVTAFFTANNDKAIAALQKEIDAVDQRKLKDIDFINQTVTNREEAAAQIAIIEARAQAQREQLQARQREEEKKKANIERLGQIATIVGNSLQGVVSLTIKAAEAKAQAALLASNPLTAPLASFALANAALISSQIPIVIGISAAQIAKLAIPRFFKGKNVGRFNDDYEGPAIVDDGGKPEAIIRENGDIEIGTDQPRVTHVKKRDIILPDANMLVNYVLAGHMGGRLAVNQPVRENSDLQDLKTELKGLRTDIRNKKELHLSASDSGLSAMWKHGANQISYLNENTNW